MDLIIFTKEGHTYKFKSVRNLKAIAKTLEFSYKGVSTDTYNQAVFIDIAGYAKLGGENENNS